MEKMLTIKSACEFSCSIKVMMIKQEAHKGNGNINFTTCLIWEASCEVAEASDHIMSDRNHLD